MDELNFDTSGLTVARALKAWAAAAGAGGAYFPTALASLVDSHERVEIEEVMPLLQAAAKVAWKRHCDGGNDGPGPKGPVLELEGETSIELVWLSDHCRIVAMLQFEDEDLHWRRCWVIVTQHTPPVGGEEYTCGFESRRAAAEAALIWSDPDESDQEIRKNTNPSLN